MTRKCPSCGTEIVAFRGTVVRKGVNPYPSKEAEWKARDVRECPNKKCSGSPNDYKRTPVIDLIKKVL